MQYCTDVTKKMLLGSAVIALCFAFVTATPSPVHAAEPPTSQADCTDGSTYRVEPSGEGRCLTKVELEKSNALNGLGNTQCDRIVDFFDTRCWGRVISVTIGTMLVALTAYLLELVTLLFNWLTYYTIVAFGDSANGFLTTSVQTGINTVWTVFRDISNILIIGFFAFIAISIILGLEKFGQKKLIARVLIVAVLINFSLLFTKVIIDGSNFLAFQFYRASLGQQIVDPAGPKLASNQVAADASFALPQDGIAGAFVKALGVTSVLDVRKKLEGIGNNPDGGGWVALMHGLFAGTLLFVAAGVILYGCLLLVSRAIYLVFLMITSSLAFATFLVPQLSTEGAGQKFGWNAWWTALIKTTVFAPLLMMLLWATLTLANAMPHAQGGTLGGLIGDAKNVSNWNAMFSYVIVIGLLFASLKVASSLSSTIGGFNFLTSLPLRLGAGIAAPVLRQTAGKLFYGQQRGLEKESEKIRGKAGQARLEALGHTFRGEEALAAEKSRQAERLEKLSGEKSLQAAKAGKFANSKYNLGDVAAVQVIGKQLGLDIGKSGKETKGYADQVKDLAKHAAEIAGKAGQPSREQIREARETAERVVQAQREEGRLTRETLQKSAEENIKLVRSASEVETKPLETETKRHEATLRDADSRKVVIENQYKAEMASADPARRREAEIQHQRGLDEQENRIREAQEKLADAKGKLASLDTKQYTIRKADGTALELSAAESRMQHEDAKQNLTAYKTETQQKLEQMKTDAVKAVNESAGAVADIVAAHEAGIFGRTLGINKDVAEATRKKMKDDKGAISQMKKAWQEINKESGSAPVQTSTPSSTSTASSTTGGSGGTVH
ncbi:hypothetical protein HY970_01110 [Candidatus Kaiserbacteria bacterium]|nr:hypothetical protein [Candidatus Kaiserbacteria bacterium]